jgi:hypothetical protein
MIFASKNPTGRAEKRPYGPAKTSTNGRPALNRNGTRDAGQA